MYQQISTTASKTQYYPVPHATGDTRLERVQARMIEAGLSRIRIQFDDGFVPRVLIIARDAQGIWGFFEGATVLCDDLETALTTAHASSNCVVMPWEVNT